MVYTKLLLSLMLVLIVYGCASLPPPLPEPSPIPLPVPSHRVVPNMGVCSPVNTYVDPTGNDSNSGSIGSPFLTIQHAINVSNPGTTVHANNGTYAENPTFTGSGGTASCNVVLTSTNGTGTGSGATVKNIVIKAPFITVQNMNVTNQTATANPNGYGIFIDTSNAHDIIVSGNYVHELCHEGIFETSTVGANITISSNNIFKPGHDAGLVINGNVGAGTFGSGTLAIDNDISQTQQRPALLGGIYSVCPTYSGGDDADWIRAFGSGHTIGQPGHGNNLHDIPHGTTANPTGSGEAHTDCLQTFISGLDHTIFEGNTCRGSDTAAHTAWIIEAGDIDGNGCGGCVNNLIIRNNTITNMNQGFSYETSYNTIHTYSNDFDHITQEALIYNAAVDGASDVIDNIFSDVGNGGDGVISTLTNSTLPTYTTNDANMTRGGSQGTFCGLATCPSSITTSPGFVGLGDGTGLGADYRLCFANGVPTGACTAISGIANSGTTIGSFSMDKVNTSRPQGSAWSIGAYEELNTGGSRPPCARGGRACGRHCMPF